MNIRSIRFKLISWYAGLLIMLFLSLGICGYLGLKYYLTQISKQVLAKRANLVAWTLLADIDKHGEGYVLDIVSKHYAPEISDRFLRITRADGSLLYTSGLPKDGSFDPSQLPVLQDMVEEDFLREESSSRGGVLIYTMPFTASNGENFMVEAGMSIQEIYDPLHGLVITLVLIFPILVAVAIGGGYLLIRRALIPVDNMTRSAERISSRNLAERLPVVKTGDELERLSISLNNMISRLDEAFQHISRFSADASHELRTPLTILHCDLETILQKKWLAPEIRETLGSALGETERLAKIVESLLTISRLDAGEVKMDMAVIDLASLVNTTVEQMRLLAEDKNIDLHCHIAECVFVNGDFARLKQLVVNLLDNAIKYTNAGGSIEVRVSVRESMGLFEVADTGIGISSEALSHVFERFYRADRARSRQLGGAGLGLSIVKAICTAHGGQIMVNSTEG
ncbi:MAG: ATP-binding protein, partial [Acidobacteriota bacterium]